MISFSMCDAEISRGTFVSLMARILRETEFNELTRN